MHSDLSLTAAQPSRLVQLYNSIERLPDTMQQIFKLLFVVGLTDEQVASRLQMDASGYEVEKIRLIRTLKSSFV